HLKRDLKPKTQQLMAAKEKVKMLEHERLALSAQLSYSEADCKNLVKEFIPIVVKRLHTSVECKKSLAAPVQLCFTAGWLGGLSLGRTEEEVVCFLSKTQDLDFEGSKSWEKRHRALFTTPYPYVQKIDDSCDLPLNMSGSGAGEMAPTSLKAVRRSDSWFRALVLKNKITLPDDSPSPSRKLQE
nr:hypothetical protein [Tanacetum cinerariifolium]